MGLALPLGTSRRNAKGRNVPEGQNYALDVRQIQRIFPIKSPCPPKDDERVDDAVAKEELVDASVLKLVTQLIGGQAYVHGVNEKFSPWTALCCRSRGCRGKQGS